MIQLNYTLKAKGLHEDEKELLGMMKSMYSDYWKTKDDGQPRNEGSEGNYWAIDYRVHRMGNGEPLIEKEIYFKTKDGKIKTKDTVDEEQETLVDAVSRERTVLEKVAFLSTAYEAHERYEGDIQRLEESVSFVDTSLHASRKAEPRRELINNIHPELNDLGEDYEVYTFRPTNTEADNHAVSAIELENAQKNETELPLPPSDSGYPRSESVEFVAPINLESTSQSSTVNTPNGRIVFGTPEPGRTL